jgi:hypothetical protein
MTTLKRLGGTSLLLVLFAIPGLAGDSSMPGAPAPPPAVAPAEAPPPAETTTSTPSAADSSDPSITATALELLGSLLDAIL